MLGRARPDGEVMTGVLSCGVGEEGGEERVWLDAGGGCVGVEEEGALLCCARVAVG